MNGKANGRKPLTGKQLLAGSRNFKMLELPEITTEDGVAEVVYLRPLRTGDVLAFVEHVKAAKESEAKEDAGIAQMLELIAKSVCDENGKLLFTVEEADELRQLDMRIFTRISSAITNMMNDRPLDYVAPKDGEEAAPAGNVSSEPTPTTPDPTASGSPIAWPFTSESGT